MRVSQAVNLSRCIQVLFVGAVLAACGDARESSYQDFKAVEATGAIEHGWVPGWLPRSAYEIREIHDSDRKSSMLRFRYQRSETVKLADDCEPITSSQAARPPFKVNWWPATVPAAEPASQRDLLFKCTADRSFVAISASGEIFHWRNK